MLRLIVFLALVFSQLGLIGKTIPSSLACNLMADAGPGASVCNPGDQVMLMGFVNDPFATYEWTPATGLSNPYSLNPTATITNTITYTLEAQLLDPVNLVFNGNFNAGAVGFSSDYIPGTGGPWGILSNEGTYAVGNNPALFHTNFSACSDHTGDATGNMMVINGAATANQNVWCQSISVTPNTDYEFGAWVAMVINSSPAILQFSINGTLIGNIFNANPTPCGWTPFTAPWNSGGNSTADICIVNLNTQPSGNDFALDDITFNEVCVAFDEVTIILNEPATTFINETVCTYDNCIVIEGIPYCGDGDYVIDLLTFQGCDSTIILTIIENNPSIIMPVLPPLTCANNTMQIDPFIDTNGLPINISWSGPNGFSSSDLNINVTQSGGYLLEIDVLLNGVVCSTAETIIIDEDIEIPIANAGGNVLMNCGDTFPVTLDGSGSSSGSNFTYIWSGPGLSSTDIEVEVFEAGNYTLLVTNTENGCQQVDAAQVIPGANLPEISPTGGTINCMSDSIMLDGESDSPNVNYLWIGPNGFMDTISNPLVGDVGMYYLTISAGIDCTVNDSVEVMVDTLAPMPMVQGGTLTCDSSSLDIMVTDPDTSLIYNWSGPGGYTGTGDTITVNASGDYLLTATSTNGCQATAIASVLADANLPDAQASGGLINCNQSTVTLMGSSATPGVITGWTGPNGFVSNELNPIVSEAGDYIFSVSAPNGCEIMVPVEVTEDIAMPELTVQDIEMGCQDSNAVLIASSAQATSFSWSGPNGFMSTENNPLVADLGIYNLIVSAANGCTNSGNVNLSLLTETIDLDISGGNLSCQENSTELVLSSTFSFSFYDWTGPNGFTSSEEMPSVGQAGTYVVLVTTVAGCTATDSIEIIADSNLPDIFAEGGTIFCDPNMLTLIGNSLSANVTFLWEGPNGFNSTESEVEVGIPGSYTFSVIANNGCVAIQEVEVFLENDPPNFDAIGVDRNCNSVDPQLLASSSESGITYEWFFNNTLFSTLDSPTPAADGEYTVFATNENGCISSHVVLVTSDYDLPEIIAVGNTIDCDNPAVNISFSSGDPISTFEWSGPNGFTSIEVNPLVTESGTYELNATGPNGCANTAQVEVLLDGAPPLFSLTNNYQIDCNNPSANFDLNLDDSTNDILWTGPNGFSSSDPQPQVNMPGTYAVTITADNGCQAIGNAEVLGDFLAPIYSLDLDTITCSNPTAQIVLTPADPDFTASWSGDGPISGGNTSASTMSVGNYQVEVTGANGCVTVQDFEIFGSTEIPIITSNDIILDCNQPQSNLSFQTSLPLVTLSWSGPNGFNSSEISPSISALGEYQLNGETIDGCQGTVLVQVTGDFSTPDISLTASQIDCQYSQSNLVAAGADPTVQITWTGPNGFTASGSNLSVGDAGVYEATATGANGCPSLEMIEVFQDTDVPSIILTIPELDCNTPTGTLQASVDISGGDFEWSDQNGVIGNLDMITVEQAGEYFLSYSLSNGCVGTATAYVTGDFDGPAIQIEGGELNCNAPDLQANPLSADVIQSWDWSGPGGFNSMLQNPILSEEGIYTVMATMSNGCFNTETITITSDFQEPQFFAAGGIINCNNLSSQLQALGPIGNYQFSWMGPNNFSSQEQNPEVSIGGVFQLSVTGGNGCVQNLIANVDVDTLLPNFSLEGGTLTCFQSSIELSPSDPIVANYLWSGPDGFNSTANGITVTEPGTYSLSMIPDNGCINEQSAVVFSDQEAPVLITEDNHIECDESEVNLNAQVFESGAVTWTGENGFLSSDINPLINVPGNYEILFVADGNGCVASSQVTVTQDDPLVSFFELSQPVCEGDLGNFNWSNHGGGVAPYLFSIDGGQNYFESIPEMNLNAGNYEFVLQDVSGCTWDSTVTVNSPPVLYLELETEITIDFGESVTLFPLFTFPEDIIETIEWSPAIGLSCSDCLNPVASPAVPTTYRLNITTDAGCETEDEILFLIKNDKEIYIPNAFSPNGDGSNDRFTVFGKDERIEYIDQIIIVDRWGEIVFRNEEFPPNDLNFGWNGELNGESMNPGVFVYYVIVRWKDGTTSSYKGDVTLMK